MSPKSPEGFSDSLDEDPLDKSKTGKEMSDIELIADICPKKAQITEEIIESYSDSLSGRVKILFDELSEEEKANVITFSMLDKKTMDNLERNPHFISGLHSRDVLFLIRVFKVCEENKNENRKTRFSIRKILLKNKRIFC